MKTIIHRQVSAVFAILFFFFTGQSPAVADNVITSGAKFIIFAGTTVVSSEKLVVKDGATFENEGMLILKKGFTNESTAPYYIGAGTVECSGTANQTISGQNIMQNFTVDNAAGVTFGGNTAVNGIFTLTTGKVILASDLLLGQFATIAGIPSAGNMFIVTGPGELRKEFAPGFTGAFTFPAGDDTGTPEYSPVTLTFTGGTFGSGNYAGVSLKNTAYPDPNITGNYLNRYWTLTQSGITGFNCNAVFQYTAADVAGSENLISCTKVNPLPWVTYSLTNAATHQLTALGIGSFSSFTGVKSATPPASQQLTNITIPGGVTNCYDATQVLTVAGNGSTFLIQNGGSVTMVAGSKISLRTGVKINNGGYLHGYISTNNIFCGAGANPLVAKAENDATLGVETIVKNQFIRVYPNPATDMVIVELTGTDPVTLASVTVYTMQGKLILEKTMYGESKIQFSLTGTPAGMYLVHVQSGEKSEIGKVVKN